MEEEDWGAFGDGADDFGAFDGAGPAPDKAAGEEESSGGSRVAEGDLGAGQGSTGGPGDAHQGDEGLSASKPRLSQKRGVHGVGRREAGQGSSLRSLRTEFPQSALHHLRPQLGLNREV